MRAILFRKLEIDGVNYYQLYGEDKNFVPDDTFADYDNRASKDRFYVDGDSDIEIDDPSFLNIYYDDNGKLKALNDSYSFERIFNVFKEKFNIVVREIKPIKEVVNAISKKILFQKEAITDLVEQIYLNQSIMASDLPVDLKLKLKNNILFYGAFGSGKKSIIECLEKELDIPYADVTISTNLKDTLEDIIKQLISRSKNNTDASYGVVYIRDNFLKLTEALGENVFNAPSFFTNNGRIDYHGQIIDFRTLTFVVLMDERVDYKIDDLDIDSIMTMADCTFRVATRVLSDKEKYSVLFGENGRLYHYNKFLHDFGKKLIVDEKALKKLIHECSKIDPGMNILNSVIDGIIKENLLCGIRDIYIDDECIDIFIPAISMFGDVPKEAKYTPKTKDEKYEEVFDEELERLYKTITKDVIGQDKQVKSILYTILENRRMINKAGLDNPKNYIKNILIRGESGSGKTMIIDKITKLLNIPTFIADSTQYTETGWVGESVTDMLACLYHAAGGDLEAAQKGILFIDEVDKKTSRGSDGGPSRGAVLDNLLKTIEGAAVSVNIGNKIQEEKILFDTSRLTVICSGAFEGIEECRDKRLGKRKVGFDHEVKQGVDKGITTEDFIAYGMNRQFMSRLPKVVELNKSTKESLIEVMKKSESSQLKIEKYKLEDRGIEIEYTEDFYERLAEVALSKKIGVRGIEQALSKVYDSINIENIKSSSVAKIILNKEVIDDPSKVIIIPREKQKVLTKK